MFAADENCKRSSANVTSVARRRRRRGTNKNEDEVLVGRGQLVTLPDLLLQLLQQVDAVLLVADADAHQRIVVQAEHLRPVEALKLGAVLRHANSPQPLLHTVGRVELLNARLGHSHRVQVGGGNTSTSGSIRSRSIHLLLNTPTNYQPLLKLGHVLHDIANCIAALLRVASLQNRSSGNCFIASLISFSSSSCGRVLPPISGKPGPRRVRPAPGTGLEERKTTVAVLVSFTAGCSEEPGLLLEETEAVLLLRHSSNQAQEWEAQLRRVRLQLASPELW
ncbi:hypothetical protein TYRP_002492 [Tyrophagus putrescentiae]|nr:hypothetical protein TYRP_002492 [Tyrophagus putrescentiae]